MPIDNTDTYHNFWMTVANALSVHLQIFERTSVDLAVSRVPESQRPTLLSLKPAS